MYMSNACRNANIAGVGVKLVLGKLLTLMTMCSTHTVKTRVYFTCLSKIGQKSTGDDWVDDDDEKTIAAQEIYRGNCHVNSSSI